VVHDLEVVLRDNLSSFFGVQDLRDLLDQWAEDGDQARQALVTRISMDDDALIRLERVMRSLIREGVPIRDRETVVEVFSQHSGRRDPRRVAERIRRAIRADLPGNEPGRTLLRLDEDVEEAVTRSLRRGGSSVLALTPTELEAVLDAVESVVGPRDPSEVALVVKSPGIRPLLRRVAELRFPSLPVLVTEELLKDDRHRRRSVTSGRP
jgi:flagellar biosynthesis protein FlhA